MKKLALTVAVMALGLAACGDKDNDRDFDSNDVVVHEDPQDTDGTRPDEVSPE